MMADLGRVTGLSLSTHFGRDVSDEVPDQARPEEADVEQSPTIRPRPQDADEGLRRHISGLRQFRLETGDFEDKYIAICVQLTGLRLTMELLFRSSAGSSAVHVNI